MELFENFLLDECVIESDQKILSTKLYQKYCHYVKIKSNIDNNITNKFFASMMKNKYSECYPRVKSNGHNFYKGVTLKCDYVVKKDPMVKKTKGNEDEIKQWRKEYNRQYYLLKKNKNILQQDNNKLRNNVLTSDGNLNYLSNISENIEPKVPKFSGQKDITISINKEEDIIKNHEVGLDKKLTKNIKARREASIINKPMPIEEKYKQLYDKFNQITVSNIICPNINSSIDEHQTFAKLSSEKYDQFEQLRQETLNYRMSNLTNLISKQQNILYYEEEKAKMNILSIKKNNQNE